MNAHQRPTRTRQLVLIGFTLILALALPRPSGAAEKHEGETPQEVDRPAALNLGEYSLREVRGAEGTKIRLDFTLYARVDYESLDQMERLHKMLKHRVREQVLIATRLCDTKEFQEPDLIRMKRRILTRLKRALPQLAIQELYFREFAYFLD